MSYISIARALQKIYVPTDLLRHMVQLEKELKGIRNELRQLRLMYKQLAEKAIPVVEPDEVEKMAVGQRDKIVSEKELLKAVK